MNTFAFVRGLLRRSIRILEPANYKRRPPVVQLGLEPLEERLNFSAAPVPESIDGTGNNLLHTTWGSAGVDLLRLAPAAYGDGISTPGGADRPSARAISNVLAAHPDSPLINNRDLTAFIYAWGQFLDHDLDLTGSASPKESFNVSVPTGDPWFDPTGTGTQVIGLSRSQYDSATGTSTNNPRQQVNTITAFIDGSQIYGSDATREAALRSFSGGHLKTSAGNMLPFNTMGLANANDAHLVADDKLYAAGDVRANENIELLSMQTLFVREHNRQADLLAKANPKLTDEQLFQGARRIVIAELQVITYREFLPALLGDQALRPYAGYNANVNPGIANEFSTAAFRFGHSMLGDDIEFLDNDGNEIFPSVELRNAFFNPTALQQSGIDPILKYLASDKAEELDTRVVDDVRNFLFGQPGQGGFDLAALNIQRGRDNGIPDYNSLRAAYGLQKVHSFAEITPDVEVQKELQSVYGSVDKIDAWVGGLAEKHLPGSSMGALFSRIIADQFTRLRDGDRFFYQNTFSPQEVKNLEQVTLADIIRANSTVNNLQPNVFFLRTSISGTVFDDRNLSGNLNPGEQGLGGITVQLLSAGVVVATTKTDAMGSYRFTELDLGKYQVKELTPTGASTTSKPVQDVAITRGMDVCHVDFGLTKQNAKPTQPPPPPAPNNMLLAGVGNLMNNQTQKKS